MMIQLLAREIIVLFALMACGFAMVRTGLLKAGDSRVLSVLSVYLILPAAFFKAFQITYTPTVASGFLLSLVAAILIHLLLYTLVFLFSRPLRLSGLEKASIIYPNAGNLIIPLVTNTLGSEWVIYCSPFMIVQLFLLWTHGLCLVRGTHGFRWKEIFTNCNLVAATLGLVCFLLHITIPPLADRVLSSIAVMVGPVAMLMIGMVLGCMDWKAAFSSRRSYLIVLLKMVVVPFIIVTVIKYSPLASLHPQGTTILLISLLATITPTATTISQMAELYDRDATYAGTINLMTTLAALVTMPLLVAYYLA